ncbi:tyrosine-type recombinase/integrase [Mycobacterium interjectum]|uniref:tyrosine-type recombinase/integrase n=1 Tax=Mycobacterium interjectum TaxID=33895 RepID=UPI000AD2F88A|nr:tyrosine-type recombinase/integrase [Mycobacterium interjectum]
MTAVLRLVRDDDGDGGLPPLDAWEIYMRGAGRSERTVRDGVAVMRRLERESGKDCTEIRAVDVSRFLASSQLRAGSRASYFGSIHAFFKWWAQQGGHHATVALPRPKAPKGSPRPVSDSGLRELLEMRMHHRTRVMILLAALAGLRVHEIAKFRGEDIDLDARTLRVTGKGGRTDSLPVHPMLVAAALTMPARGWWFPANSRRPGDHVHGKSVSDIIGNAMRRAGVPGTPHGLRHSFGSNLVASGADLRTAQTLLRHANLQTTAIYVQVADGKRVEAIDRLTLPVPSEAERVQEMLSQQLERCKQSIVRLLGALGPGEQMSRTRLSQALRSDVRPQIDAALDELVDEGVVDPAPTDRGRAYRCAPRGCEQ